MSTILVGGRPTLPGCDIAVYQPVVNWQRYAQGRHWVAIKASGGDGGIYTDPRFSQHRDNSRGVVPRSAYHFLGDGNGRAQAQHFAAVTAGYTGFELPATVDVETDLRGRLPSSQTVADFWDEFHRIVKARWTGPTGKPVALMIYGGAPSARAFYPGLVDADFWLAAYLNPYYPNPWNGVTNGDTPNVGALGLPNRYIPAPWKQWSIWQFAGGDGGAPGVGNERSNCDQDVAAVDFINRVLGGTPPQGDDTLSAEEIQQLRNDIADLKTTFAQWSQDDRQVIINGVNVPLTTKLTFAGWSSRDYPFGFGNEPDGNGGDGAQFYLDKDGLAHHIINDTDLGFLTKVGKLNPDTQWLPLGSEDAVFDAHPIKAHPRHPELLPAKYQKYVL